MKNLSLSAIQLPLGGEYLLFLIINDATASVLLHRKIIFFESYELIH